MSFEGYYQIRCKGTPSHGYTQDCYTYSYNDGCQCCGATTEANLVDETNGGADGYDPDFLKDCVVDVSLPSNIIDHLRDRELMLDCLEEVGVDNWDGYYEAMKLYKERKK